MNKLSLQDEKEFIIFIKDWLKSHGYSQKDLANQLNLNSCRTSEILKKIKDLHKKGGLYNVAKELIKVEQNWLDIKNDNNIQGFSENTKSNLKPYSQLDLNYKLDIDQLMDQMEKDHSNK